MVFDHGRPWSTMVLDHGRPWLDMVLIRPWSALGGHLTRHGRPWSTMVVLQWTSMVDHGIPWSSDHHFHLGGTCMSWVKYRKNILESNESHSVAGHLTYSKAEIVVTAVTGKYV